MVITQRTVCMKYFTTTLFHMNPKPSDRSQKPKETTDRGYINGLGGTQ